MSRHCSVPGCIDSSAQFPLHYIPFVNLELCKLWLKAIKNSDLSPDKDIKPLKILGSVCGKHFLPSDYERDLKNELIGSRKKNILKDSAVPSQFLPSSITKKPVSTIKQSTASDHGVKLQRKRVSSLRPIQPQPAKSLTKSASEMQNNTPSVKLTNLSISEMLNRKKQVSESSTQTELEHKTQMKDKGPKGPPSMCGKKDNAVTIFGEELSRIVEPVAMNLCFAVQGLVSALSQQQAQFLQLVENVENIQNKHDRLKTDFDDFMQNTTVKKSGKKRKMEYPLYSHGYLRQVQRKRRKICFAETQWKKCRPDTAKFLKEMRYVKAKRVTRSLIRRNFELCEKYTGFPSYSQLKDVFNKIVSDPIFMASTEDCCESSVRKLSLENEFLMTLVKIKMMVPVGYLCSQYKVSRSVVREAVSKWTGVLVRTLVGLETVDSSLKPLLTISKRFLHKHGLITNGNIPYEPMPMFTEVICADEETSP